MMKRWNIALIIFCAAANLPVTAADALPNSLLNQLNTKQHSLSNALQLGVCKVTTSPARAADPWDEAQKAFWLRVADRTLISWLTLARERSPNLEASILNLNRSLVMHEQIAARQGIRTHFSLAGARSLSKSSDGNLSVNTLWSIQNTTSYDIDVWGKKKRELEQSQLNLHASQIDAQFLLLNLDVSIAQAYWHIQLLQTQHAVLLDTLQETQLQVQDLQLLSQLGLIPKQNLENAELALTQQKTLVLASQALITKLKLQIAVDIGVGSECLTNPTEVKLPASVFDAPQMPFNQPAELLLRRADLQSAEILWRQAKLQLLGAKSAALPTVGLSFSLSDSQNLLAKLLQSVVLGITAGLNLSFDPLEYRSQIDLSDIALQAQEVAYRSTVHRAIHQVADVQQTAINLESDEALAHKELLQRLRELDSAQASLDIGTSSALPVRQAQLGIRQAYLRSFAVQDAKRNNLLRMYLALGGPPRLTK
jgi:outer membrane protein TolC